jgi:diguanylate cyclase
MKMMRRSLKDIYNKSILLVPLLIGLVFIVVQGTYIIYGSVTRYNQEVESYRNEIKARIENDVHSAVYMANYYIEVNQEKVDEETLKLEVVALFEKMTAEYNGYYFSADYEGTTIFGPSKGNNVYHIEDKNGLKVVQELIKAAQSGGGFVEYVMPPIEGVEQLPKLSYVMPFDRYGWYVGAGIFLNQMEAIEDSIIKRAYLEGFIAVLSTVVVIGLGMILMIVLNRRIYRRFGKQILRMRDYLKEAEGSDVLLDSMDFDIDEISQIAEGVTRLVEMRIIQRQRIKSMVEALPDVIFVIQRDGWINEIEAGKKTWISEKAETIRGNHIKTFVDHESLKLCLEYIQMAIETNEIQVQELRRNEEGVDKYYELRYSKLDQERVIMVLRDISELTRSRLNIEYLSYHDALTGLHNRRFFEEEMRRYDNPRDLPLSIIMVDVNGLKLTNDAFGHVKGDALLVKVAHLLKLECRAHDVIARIGGDEFVILLPHTTKEDTAYIVERIYMSMKNEYLDNIIVSISAGWDTKDNQETMIVDVFNNAEAAMYQRKLTEGQSMRNKTVQVILRTLHEKTEGEKYHSERVSQLCMLIGEALELDQINIKELELAGLLHDIGKISIADGILNKPGKLSDFEYVEIKRHPESGYQILKSIDAYASVADDVLSHHERYDGTGYPRGLKGDEITLIARIMTIADAYAAMTSPRKYRPMLNKQQALDELIKNGNTQFDLSLVKVFEDKVWPYL